MNSRKDRNLHNEVITRLEQGVDAFNAWRTRNPGAYIQLSSHDFKDRDLRGVDFSGTKLKGSDFSGALLQNGNFRGANLNGVKLLSSDCTGCDMRQARLARADFTNATLTNANLYGTIRNGWQITDVICEHCWITRDRHYFANEPDVFQDGEFEIAYGGRRMRLKLPGGFQPIDLVALPFYARIILDRYKGKRIVFAGLSTVGEACLEFRVEDVEPQSEEIKLQTFLNGSAAEIRKQSEEHLHALLRIREEQTTDQRRTIDTLSTLLLQVSQHRGGGDIRFLVAGDVNVVWDRMSSSTDIEALRAELNRLSEVLKRESRTEEAGNVSAAEDEIAQGNGVKALSYLKKAGSWAFETATKIGADIAAAAIKQSIGLK